MPLTDASKMRKLTVTGYRKRARKQNQEVGVFVAMYNPTSFTEDYEIRYGSQPAHDSSNRPAKFAHSPPARMQFELLLDGTPVSAAVAGGGEQKPVRQQIQEFQKVAYRMNGSAHEPNFLIVQWGDGLNMRCRLDRLGVSYTSFDRGGEPLRAKLNISLVADDTPKRIAAKERKSSPDVTHTRLVKGGDTLPLLAAEVYGSAGHYLFVAAANDLDHFRRLEPGTVLVFPPLPAPPGGAA